MERRYCESGLYCVGTRYKAGDNQAAHRGYLEKERERELPKDPDPAMIYDAIYVFITSTPLHEFITYFLSAIISE